MVSQSVSLETFITLTKLCLAGCWQGLKDLTKTHLDLSTIRAKVRAHVTMHEQLSARSRQCKHLSRRGMVMCNGIIHCIFNLF